jgi:hypothetical protein
MKSVDRSHMNTDVSYHGNSGIYGSSDSRDKIRKLNLMMPRRMDAAYETHSNLSATFRTTRSQLDHLPLGIVPSENVKMVKATRAQKNFLPEILEKKGVSKVISRSQGPAITNFASEVVGEETDSEISIYLASSQKRLTKLKMQMTSKLSGLSRNVRRKLNTIADMDVLKNKKIFIREVDVDPKRPEKFKFYKFVKTDVDVGLHLMQHTIAIQDYMLSELEISQVCNHVYKSGRLLRNFIMDRVSDIKHSYFMWNKLAMTKLPELKTISVSGEDPDIAKLILKYFTNAYSDLSGSATKLYFHGQDFNSRRMADLINWENLFLKTHLLELTFLESTNSFLFDRMVEESSHRLAGLRWLTIRKSHIKVRFFAQSLKDLKGLQVLSLDQCEMDRKDTLMAEVGSSLKHCSLLSTLRFTKCKLQQSDVQDFLLNCFKNNPYDLRCLDISQNCVFAESLIAEFGEQFVYFMINSAGQYCPMQYIEETWNSEIFDTLYSRQFKNVLFYKQKLKALPQLSFRRLY